jgi:hypothetical protein
MAVAVAVARRPDLWTTAWRQVVVLIPPGWWRRWPPVPAPDVAYLRFRRQTAYGTDGSPIPPSDAIGYLEWCRRMRASGA